MFNYIFCCQQIIRNYLYSTDTHQLSNTICASDSQSLIVFTKELFLYGYQEVKYCVQLSGFSSSTNKLARYSLYVDGSNVDTKEFYFNNPYQHMKLFDLCFSTFTPVEKTYNIHIKISNFCVDYSDRFYINIDKYLEDCV